MFCGGDAGGFHGLLCEGLRPFQGGVRSHWTEACSALKRIGQSVTQGRLWTDDHEVNVELVGQGEQTVDVSSTDGMVGSKLCRTGIPGSGVEFHLRIARQGHGQRVFTLPRADKEDAPDVHATRS